MRAGVLLRPFATRKIDAEEASVREVGDYQIELLHRPGELVEADVFCTPAGEKRTRLGKLATPSAYGSAPSAAAVVQVHAWQARRD